MKNSVLTKLVYKLTFLLILCQAGCATGPHIPGQKWSWVSGTYVDTPESAAYSRRVTQDMFRQANEKVAEIERENPGWANAVSDDVLIIECNQDKTVCIGR